MYCTVYPEHKVLEDTSKQLPLRYKLFRINHSQTSWKKGQKVQKCVCIDTIARCGIWIVTVREQIVPLHGLIKTLTEVFRAFSSVVRQMPGYTRKDRARPALILISELCCSTYFLCRLCCSMYCLCKCVLYYCHWLSTQLQLNISYHIISCHISYHV